MIKIKSKVNMIFIGDDCDMLTEDCGNFFSCLPDNVLLLKTFSVKILSIISILNGYPKYKDFFGEN